MALSQAARRRRIAGPRLDADGQCHLCNRRFQVARNVDRERLERRNVERVQRRLAARPEALRVRFRPAEIPASVFPPPVGATSKTESPRAAWSSSAS